MLSELAIPGGNVRPSGVRCPASVLLAAGNGVNQKVAVRLLERAYSVVYAIDEREALEALRREPTWC
jgi:CheY-like chemotaxis protein